MSFYLYLKIDKKTFFGTLHGVYSSNLYRILLNE